MSKWALTTKLPSLEPHGACSLEPIIPFSLLSSLMVSLLNLMPSKDCALVGGGWFCIPEGLALPRHAHLLRTYSGLTEHTR